MGVTQLMLSLAGLVSAVVIVHVANETACQPVSAAVINCVAMVVAAALLVWTSITTLSAYDVEILGCVAALIVIAQVGAYSTVSTECRTPLHIDIQAGVAVWCAVALCALFRRLAMSKSPIDNCHPGLTIPLV